MILEEIIRKQKQQIERLETNNRELLKISIDYKDKIDKAIETIKQLEEKIDSMKESYETDAEAKYYDYVDKHESKLQERLDRAVETLKSIKEPLGYSKLLINCLIDILEGRDKE